MCTALVSLFSGRPVRNDTAMTGRVVQVEPTKPVLNAPGSTS